MRQHFSKAPPENAGREAGQAALGPRVVSWVSAFQRDGQLHRFSMSGKAALYAQNLLLRRSAARKNKKLTKGGFLYVH